MGCYTERERQALFHSWGYREDGTKRTGPVQYPEIDPSCSWYVLK